MIKSNRINLAGGERNPVVEIKNIAIIGLGLIGGSMAKAIAEAINAEYVEINS